MPPTDACSCPPETFWSLFTSLPHWELEVVIVLVMDGLVGCLAWPFLKKHFAHHLSRDRKEGIEP